MLSGSDANSKTSSSSFNELNAGEKAALVHEQVNNAGAEAHQTQARKSFAGCIRTVTAGGLVLSVRCAAGLY
jgi:hypothetical protein